MLNRDEYNQEEYNEYYRQETGRVKSQETKSNGLIGKLIILLILLALAIAGYFGYKAMNNQSTSDDLDSSLKVTEEPSLPKSIQAAPQKEEKIAEEQKSLKEENTPTIKIVEEKETLAPTSQPQKSASKEDKPANKLESAITSEVTKVVSSTEGKMSSEELASVVSSVIEQMNQEKSTNTVTQPTLSTKEDSQLIEELADSEVDSVSTDLVKELEHVDIGEDTEIDHSQKQIDVYNKVKIEEESNTNSLDQLSEQISALMANEEEFQGQSQTQTHTQSQAQTEVVTYTESLKSEVSVRANEMRVIVVRKGDTLGKIAKRAYGNAMAYKKIYRANPELTRPDRIYVGQKLRIPN